ncbi:hypothetical protein [Paenibacillus sp. JCM 10914]|uniref:hypothetical protein n=1 Tax=Paenibacillus sp. JCM 10914 TaxID=1236974 RepID=UPI000B05D5BB|nr:hypothetical protein [Paenibacillus sp. JCM 10914]
MSVIVPFERSLAMLPPALCAASAVQLEAAKEFEAAAIGYLEQAIMNLKEK